MLRPIDLDAVIHETLIKAKSSPRRRANRSFHTEEDVMQRMVNSGYSDTYLGPHRHGKHVKLEIFIVLKGRGAFLSFDDTGKVTSCVALDEKGPVKMVEVPPQDWHSLIVLSEEASFLEIVEGKYDPVKHKELPAWAPPEGSAEVLVYLAKLKRIVNEFQTKGGVQ